MFTTSKGSRATSPPFSIYLLNPLTAVLDQLEGFYTFLNMLIGILKWLVLMEKCFFFLLLLDTLVNSVLEEEFGLQQLTQTLEGPDESGRW